MRGKRPLDRMQATKQTFIKLWNVSLGSGWLDARIEFHAGIAPRYPLSTKMLPSTHYLTLPIAQCMHTYTNFTYFLVGVAAAAARSHINSSWAPVFSLALCAPTFCVPRRLKAKSSVQHTEVSLRNSGEALSLMRHRSLFQLTICANTSGPCHQKRSFGELGERETHTRAPSCRQLGPSCSFHSPNQKQVRIY